MSLAPTFLKSAPWQENLFSGGQWRPARGGTRDVMEPATGAVLGRTGVASGDDMREAITRAHAAQAAWAATSPRDRAAVMQKASTLLMQHFDELALAIARETGGILPKGQHEVREASVICQIAAGLPFQAQGDILPSTPGRLSLAKRVPHGVVGVISPFNFPLILGIRAVAPALALGNAVVLKPDTRTPVSGGVIMAEVFRQAGLPDGVFEMIPGDAEAR